MPELSRVQWRAITRQLDAGRLVPVIGNRVTSQLLFDQQEFVQAWSDDIGYPLGGSHNVTRLAQYLSVEASDRAAKEEFITFSKNHLLKLVARDGAEPDGIAGQLGGLTLPELAARLDHGPLRDADANPLLRFAQFPIKIFITTSYHAFLAQALRAAGKTPRLEICYWDDLFRAPPPPKTELNPLARLKEILTNSYSLGELFDLAWDMGLNHEDLAHETKPEFTREFLNLLERHNRLPELVRLGQRQRSDLSWAGILAGEEESFAASLGLERRPSLFDVQPDYRPTVAEPLVFHLLGLEQFPDSMVLTENDYLDFLLRITADTKIFPPPIRTALNKSSLILLGYHMQDWDFRVLFRYLSTRKRRDDGQGRGGDDQGLSVAIQLLPAEDGQDKEAVMASASRYLERYFGQAGFTIYLGQPAEFTQELWRRWEGQL